MGWGARAAGLLVVAVGAVAAGFGLARANDLGERPAPAAVPIPAEPSLPVDPSTPPAPDIDYPTLRPGLAYEPRTLGRGAFAWVYDAPSGWRRYGADDGLDFGEYRWRPPDEPTVGGYSLRVKLVNTHQTPGEMVAAKEAALTASPEAYVDFTVLSRTEDTLAFTYRVPSSNTLRYNTFRWIAPPGSTEVGIEMSVAGRERDEAGLADLLARVSASFRPR